MFTHNYILAFHTKHVKRLAATNSDSVFKLDKTTFLAEMGLHHFSCFQICDTY